MIIKNTQNANGIVIKFEKYRISKNAHYSIHTSSKSKEAENGNFLIILKVVCT